MVGYSFFCFSKAPRYNYGSKFHTEMCNFPNAEAIPPLNIT